MVLIDHVTCEQSMIKRQWTWSRAEGKMKGMGIGRASVPHDMPHPSSLAHVHRLLN